MTPDSIDDQLAKAARLRELLSPETLALLEDTTLRLTRNIDGEGTLMVFCSTKKQAATISHEMWLFRREKAIKYGRIRNIRILYDLYQFCNFPLYLRRKQP